MVLFADWNLEKELAHPAAWPDMSDYTSPVRIMETGPLFPCVRTLSAGVGIITVRHARSSVFLLQCACSVGKVAACTKDKTLKGHLLFASQGLP